MAQPLSRPAWAGQICFLAAEGALYAALLALDLTGSSSTPVRYAAICLCAGAAALLLGRDWLIPLALVLTLGADTFLLLLDEHYLLGVLLFCLVQTLYAARLAAAHGGALLLPRLVLFAAALAALWLLDALVPLTAASAWSFSQLTLSALEAPFVRRLVPGGALLAWGLGLFWCCDVCVGIYNAAPFLPALPLEGLIPLASFGMWLFYLPAQVLIVLSLWRYPPRKG